MNPIVLLSEEAAFLMSGLKCRKPPFLCHGVASRCRLHKTRELLVRGETSTECFGCFLCHPSVLLVYHLTWRGFCVATLSRLNDSS